MSSGLKHIDNYASREVLRKIKSMTKIMAGVRGMKHCGEQSWLDWFLRVVLFKKD